MSDKIFEDVIYKGLGFDIVLHNVEKIKTSFDPEPQPIIDVRKVAAAAIQTLSTQESDFSINQLLFIKANFKINTNDFATLIQKPVAEVKGWENVPDKSVQLNAKVKTALQQFMQQQTFINRKDQEKENTKLQNKLLISKSVFAPSKKKSDPAPEQKTTIKKKKSP